MRLGWCLAIMLTFLCCSAAALAETCPQIWTQAIRSNSPVPASITLPASNPQFPEPLQPVDYVYSDNASYSIVNGTVRTTTGVTARVFVNGNLTIGNNVQLNAGGPAENLILVVTGSLSIGNNSQINGFILAGGAITLNNNVQINGAVTAKGAVANYGATVSYNSDALNRLDGGSLCEAALACLADNFNGSLSTDNWVTSNSSGSFTPTVVSGWLRMTQAVGNQSTSATYQRLYPAADNLVIVEFDYRAYGGNGADGLAVVLSDATVTPQPGAFGGPLGYGFKPGIDGFAGGWLGFGIDEYGNYSAEGGSSNVGRRRQSVAIRGSGSGTSGYRYLRGTCNNGTTNTGTACLSPAVDGNQNSPHRYRFTIDSRTSGSTLVSVDRDSGSGYVNLIAPFNAQSQTGQAAVPANFFLSITASTGGSNNIHELDNLSICALRSLPVGEQIDHFEFDYSGQALTCKPESFTVRACKNAACTELVTQQVTATLSPVSGGNVTWQTANPITFSGGSTTVSLRRTVAGSSTVGVSSSVPSTRPLSQTLCRAGSGALSAAACAVNFAESGLVFDVADGIANQPQDNVIVSAVKTGAAQQCVPSFANVTRNVAFWSSYITPDSSGRPVSWPVTVNTQQVGQTEASRVNIPLNFNAQGQASISVNYADAGQMQLNARYTGSAANNDTGLVMNGADQFIRRPLGLCVQTGGECSAADASCNRFRRAGESFPLTISARAWQSGSTSICSNPVTPNFTHNGINLTHSLVAPSPGATGTLLAASYNHSRQLQAQTVVTQSVSEVGVFRFGTAAFNYLTMADPVPAANSVATGRFYPKDFLLSDATLTSGCSSFSYMQQPFAAGFKLTARNMQNARTSNYAGAFATSNVLLQAENNNNGVALTSRLSGTVNPTWSQGELTYQATALQFSRTADGSADGPYSQLMLAVNAFDNDGVTVANADTNVSTTGDCSGAGNCNARQLAQTDIRYGRMLLQNTSGPEEAPLPLVFRAEYWDGSRFIQNLADNCSQINPVLLANPAGNPTQLQFGGSVQTMLNGQLAAGPVWIQPTGSTGSWLVEYQAPVYLRYHWRGTPAGYQQSPQADIQFGRFRGNPRQIFWREKFQ